MFHTSEDIDLVCYDDLRTIVSSYVSVRNKSCIETDECIGCTSQSVDYTEVTECASYGCDVAYFIHADNNLNHAKISLKSKINFRERSLQQF